MVAVFDLRIPVCIESSESRELVEIKKLNPVIFPLFLFLW